MGEGERNRREGVEGRKGHERGWDVEWVKNGRSRVMCRNGAKKLQIGVWVFCVAKRLRGGGVE